jgi:asparagine synthase (glutamine-hydrolysing)
MGRFFTALSGANDVCGIAGHLRQVPTDQGTMLEMVRTAVHLMRHRGPDDEVAAELAATGAWGMCRLAIRDPSPAGRQPFWHGRIGVLFNGEIYNTGELSKTLELRGHSFHSGCDTEVLLKAYVEFGTAAFGLLDGIFAVAVVDPEANEFLLARDEFGVKPLFVNSSSGRLAFGPEPKALQALGALNGGIDEEQLVRYLRCQYVPEPESPWQNVRRIGGCSPAAVALRV